MPTAGRVGIPFIYNEIIVEPDQILQYKKTALLSDLYVNWSGHFENVDDNHAINRTLECHLLLYITEGYGYIKINGEHYTIYPGSILFIEKNTEHTYGNQQDAWWSGYWAHFSGTVSDSLVRQYFNNSYALFEIGVNETLEAVFADMHKQMRLETQLINVLHAANAIRYILSLITQLRIAKNMDNVDGGILDRVVDVMYKNIARPITLKELAQDAHLSQSQLVRIFRKKTGYTPMEYYNLARMKEACNKILHGENNVSAIARSLGFENQYYFSTVFKRMFGFSPTQFMRCMRK